MAIGPTGNLHRLTDTIPDARTVEHRIASAIEADEEACLSVVIEALNTANSLPVRVNLAGYTSGWTGRVRTKLTDKGWHVVNDVRGEAEPGVFYLDTKPLVYGQLTGRLSHPMSDVFRRY